MAIPSVNMFSQQPGGGLVTAMRGMNALTADNLNNQILGVKAQYAPLTTQADAASKLAYSQLMAPQFMAKLMGNPDILANMTPDQRNAALANIYRAGSGQGTGNALMGMPRFPMPQNNRFSLTGFLSDKLKNVFGGGDQPQAAGSPSSSSNPFAMNFSGAGVNPQLNKTMAGIANVESSGSKNPYSLIGKDTGNGDRALGKYQVMASNVPAWTKEAFGQSMTPEQFLQSPEAQEKLAGYMINKHLNAGNSPQDVGSIWFSGKPQVQAGNVQDVNGTTVPQYVDKMNQGMNQINQPAPLSNALTSPSQQMGGYSPTNTFAENVGSYQGIKKEGEESGKIRANDIKDLNDIVFNANTKQATLDDVNNMLASPEIREIRQLPLAGRHEMGWYAKEGTPAQQQLVGRLYAQMGNIIKDSSRDFAGQFRKGEQQLLQGMKPTDSDTVDTMIGKAESLTAMNQLLRDRAQLTSQYMNQYHINKGQAESYAEKQINADQIRKTIHDKLNPTVTIRNPKTGEKLTIPVSEARAGGFKGG